MSYVTSSELVEIVPDLRAMANVEASAAVRAALIRLANRYAAMAACPEAPIEHEIREGA
jgi:hypothetical protein